MIDPRTSMVLQTMYDEHVRCLLTGGQACVIYGAAEFSKDVDFVVLADTENLERLKKVAKRLAAEVIAVPPFQKKYLDEGLAIHLRCGLPEIADFRIDLMSKMRGVARFEDLWKRRTTVETGTLEINLMSVKDLIQSKKTQRSKDWPMIQRLVEVRYLHGKDGVPDTDEIDLWLREMRTVELIVEVAQRFEKEARKLIGERPLLIPAIKGQVADVRSELNREIETEKEADRIFWEPLKARLGELRQEARGNT